MTADGGSLKGFRGKSALYFVLIIAGTIIILAAITAPWIRDGIMCTKIKIFDLVFEHCPLEASALKAHIEQNASDTVSNVPPIPGEATAVSEVVERAMSNTSDIPLTSIVGHWFAVGNTSDQKQISASFAFGSDNQYTSLFNFEGSLSQPIVGTYIFSPGEKKLTIQPYGQVSQINTIEEIASDSFIVSDNSGTRVSFGRAD